MLRVCNMLKVNFGMLKVNFGFAESKLKKHFGSEIK